MLQLAYFDRSHRPVTMNVGPVLALKDLAGKPEGRCRLASRVEPRDYIDTAAAMRRYPVGQLIGFAKRLDPGLEDRDFADAGRQLDPDARRGVRPLRARPSRRGPAARAIRRLATRLTSQAGSPRGGLGGVELDVHGEQVGAEHPHVHRVQRAQWVPGDDLPLAGQRVLAGRTVEMPGTQR